MLSSADREAFAYAVMDEVRRWPGVELRPHPSHTQPGESDGVEFRLFGRQFGHVHASCDLHLSLTKGLKQWVLGEDLAAPLTLSSAPGWAMYQPMTLDDAKQTIWLLRLNYVRLRRQRLTPAAAAGSALLQQHEAALAVLRPGISPIIQRTQARSRRRPLPGLEL